MSLNKIILIFFFLIYSNSTLADSKYNLGLDIFNNKAQCGTCHTLKAANSEGLIGPNLDSLKPSIGQTIYAVTNGIGVMPPWDTILTKKEIEAVAYFIFNSTSN